MSAAELEEREIRKRKRQAKKGNDPTCIIPIVGKRATGSHEKLHDSLLAIENGRPPVILPNSSKFSVDYLLVSDH